MGSIVNDYMIGDSTLDTLIESIDAQRIGLEFVNLTNFDNDTIPQISSGSIVEIDGDLFVFPIDDSIGGSPIDGDVYILLTVSGSSVTASFTNTAPTWDTARQGWYSGTNRYANFIMTKSGANYSDKRRLPQNPNEFLQVEKFNITNFEDENIIEDGYVKIGNLYIQWGVEPSITNSNRTVNFPITFPNNCFVVTGDSEDFVVGINTITAASFRLSNGFVLATGTIYWMAMGN